MSETKQFILEQARSTALAPPPILISDYLAVGSVPLSLAVALDVDLMQDEPERSLLTNVAAVAPENLHAHISQDSIETGSANLEPDQNRARGCVVINHAHKRA